MLVTLKQKQFELCLRLTRSEYGLKHCDKGHQRRFHQDKLPINIIRTGMRAENQLQHRTDQLPGLKWTRWLITRKQASDFLKTLSGPSQLLCLTVKSPPQDSWVCTSWALINSLLIAQYAALWGAKDQSEKGSNTSTLRGDMQEGVRQV